MHRVERSVVQWLAPGGALDKKALQAAWRVAVRRAFPPISARAALLGWLAGIVLGVAPWILWADPGGNLASDKPVTVSALCRSRPEHSWINASPARLVDGKKWRHYDTCTEKMPNPWVRIDLQAPVRIDRVVVTGRRDCCWGARDLPLLLELSMDGEQFQEAARRVLPFSDREPWRVDLPHARARHLRLRVPTEERASIVLTELEVYGEADTR